ncbi:helicase [Streptomyces sp. NRRL B-1677]|uniref:Helicase n=1 Tax=Streptomyces klenkii TaxID=1420899 RepID=A0A3B0BP15_9ACTN|nr:helicase [Streptomyces sp. NRRL B-1677]RKN74652.1 helicase [Streptomyces klenkii]
MRRRRCGDRGTATVWVAVAATALCAVFAALLAMGQAVVARHRAGGAADLAALAAADHALEGQDAACGLARRVAAAQGTRVVRCAVSGEIAEVAAEARAGPYAVRVRSRAGPAEAVGFTPVAVSAAAFFPGSDLGGPDLRNPGLRKPGLPGPGLRNPGLPGPGPQGCASPGLSRQAARAGPAGVRPAGAPPVGSRPSGRP